MEQILKELFEKYNLEYDHSKIAQIIKFYDMVIETNKVMNLTNITEEKEFAINNILDCILPMKIIPVNAKVLDIGAGAGFPSIPLKIMRPDIQLTLLDSLNKRLIFLKEVCNNIGIDAEIIHKRAEEGGRDKNLREKFDIATSRAVANMNTLSEYLMPFVKVKGKMVAMKGKNGAEELKNAKGAIKTLNGEIVKCDEFLLPNGDERTIIVVNKKSHTPMQYPRQGGKIKNNPLK